MNNLYNNNYMFNSIMLFNCSVGHYVKQLDTVLQATIIVVFLGSSRGFWTLKGNQICDFILWPFSPTVSRGVSCCNSHSYLISHSLETLKMKNIVFL